MVDIQSATTEIRRGIQKKKKQDKNIMSASATQRSHLRCSLMSNYLVGV